MEPISKSDGSGLLIQHIAFVLRTHIQKIFRLFPDFKMSALKNIFYSNLHAGSQKMLRGQRVFLIRKSVANRHRLSLRPAPGSALHKLDLPHTGADEYGSCIVDSRAKHCANRRIISVCCRSLLKPEPNPP